MEYGAVFVWWVTFLALGVVGLPIAATLLQSLPDRGAALALPLSVLVFGLPIFWIGHLSFGPIAIGAGLLVLVGLSIATAWRGPDIEVNRFVEWSLVFTLAFALLVAIRAFEPSIRPAGGEKFLDFGLLQALLRASSLPPEDMWFAGEPVQYYYGGHMISAVLTTITGTAARYAYNLALAGFYAMLVAGAYGIAGSIAASRDVSYRRGGFLGAFFVGIASNLVPVVQAILRPLPDGIANDIAALLTTTERGYGITQVDLAAPEQSPTPYYWIPSRVIEGMINEFPLFAWLNGDLHAHMMSTPFLLLAIGIAFAYYLTPEYALRRRRLLVFGALPPVAGLIAVVNTWSFPTVAGIAGVTALFAPGDPWAVLRGNVDEGGGTSNELRRVLGAGAVAAIVAIVGIVLAFPFFAGPATGASGRSIGLVGDRSSLVGFLLVHGWMLAIFVVYLVSRSDSLPDSPDVGARLVSFFDRPEVVLALIGLLLAIGVVLDLAAFALVLPLLGLVWLLLRNHGDGGFESVLIFSGAGLVLLVEAVYLMEQAGSGRMNTVFKVYMQVWVLWAIAAGASLVQLVPSFPWPDSGGPRTSVATVLAVLLVLSTAIYGGVALGSHFDSAVDPTLDGTQAVQQFYPEKWEAIQWLAANATQDTTILSAPGAYPEPGMYSWESSPAASFTGIPTVAGWAHEIGYRGAETYQERVEEVDAAYTDNARAPEVLRTYDVTYVWVGPAERSRYDDVTISDVSGVELVYQTSTVWIYRVDRSELPD